MTKRVRINKLLYILLKPDDQQGVSAVMIALMLVVLISFAALAIDISHLYVVRNELQNASDSGALASARVLYNEDGTVINANANQTGYDSATANRSEQELVEVHWTGGNEGDVQRGHWSFATRTFTPNISTTPMQLWDYTTAELDTNTNFINAVRVRARRESTPATSFFARILGHENFTLATDSVAYLGFAGSLGPGEADMPIAICKDSLVIDGKYTCSVGRMINSGPNTATNETGGWTSFYQQIMPEDTKSPCTGGTNANELRDIIDPPGPLSCFGENVREIILGKDMATLGGEAETAFDKLRNCWEEATNKARSWNLTLPVIECPSNNVGTCEKVVGAVNVNVVWITGKGNDPQYNQAPYILDDWSSSDSSGQIRWGSFVDHFNLKNADGSPAPYQKKAIYFRPDCTPHEPAGRTGGQNFGVLAKIPVLVE